MGEIQKTVQKTANSDVGAAFIRWGHAIRGALYIVMGILAIEWALGKHNQAPGPSQVIALAAQSPLSKILLILIILGLVGYLTWGLVRLSWKRPLATRF